MTAIRSRAANVVLSDTHQRYTLSNRCQSSQSSMLTLQFLSHCSYMDVSKSVLYCFYYHTVYSQVSQKNSSKLGSLKNLLNQKGCLNYFIQHQSNPNPGVDCWLYSVWAFPRLGKISHTISLHTAKMLAHPLWFSSFSLVSHRNMPPYPPLPILLSIQLP